MKKAVFCSCAVALLTIGASAQAAILLTVDITDPLVVKITATGEAPSVSNSSVGLSSGITLLGLFADPVSTQSDSSMPLQELFANGASSPYTTVSMLNYVAGSRESSYDLNFYGIGGGQNFTLGVAAFSGTAEISWYLSDVTFRAVGSTGNIVLGYSNSSGGGVVIGQYQVIPEPSALVLAGLVPFVGMARFFRRRA